MKKKKNKDIIKEKLESLCGKNSIRKIFEDFVICCAYAISNGVIYDQGKEDAYLHIVKDYTKEELNTFANMLAYLYDEYQKDDNEDILGQLYEEFNLYSKAKGQFFTPENICDLMSKITIDSESVNKIIESKGYISLNDPACGSGRTLISSIERFRNLNVDINDIYVTGEDVSLFCACMTYINLSLMGASGAVSHKNTLTNETYTVFYTPQLVMNKDLQQKLFNDKKEEGEIENG